MLLGVDVGGTFTDAVLVDPGGEVHSTKLPTTTADESAAVLEVVGAVLSSAGARSAQVQRFAHGMTVATNALLQGHTARTALIATAGFTDVIELARQTRPHLYDLCRGPAAPLVPNELRFGAPERIGPDGTQRALQRGAARALVREVAAAEPRAVAVALLHSYRDPTHERMLGELLAQELQGVHCSLSSELVGTFREYERTATTVVDAALSPLLASYLGRLAAGARACDLPEPQVMQSSGGLTELARAGAHAALTVLSGPAGGVGGAAMLARLSGIGDALCFDMGGTSCDACVIEGFEVAESAQRTIADRPLSLPALDIHTVGAGGGSIAWRDSGGALRVGPQSAGALPGPACYGRGGMAPTVTDANLLLGRLRAEWPLAGGVRLHREAAERAVGELARQLSIDTLACAEGIVRVVEREMLAALRLLTVERGIDPRGFVLLPFGGAGPLHAVAMAEELGVRRVLCPSASGVLSALGLAASAPRRDASRSVLLGGAELEPERLRSERDELVARAAAALGERPERARVRHELRYRGQSFELAIDGADAAPAQLREAFAAAHERRYGYREEDGEIELVTMRASVWGAAPDLRLRGSRGGSPESLTADVVLAGEPVQTTVLRGAPRPGQRLRGPMLCALPESSLLIAPGWRGQVDEYGSCHLERER
ncbi:MAG TPA: hydantoinase/oxoprolinase family protein [Solirubrobacteraceae bacterium]|nr:hydantoinase/oxoprolinase family protein [Solirubrobacteraceae bacterium]